uniref:Uncharacterized protein n=1 Tax=Panagrellus redivivus TaxID=6233 RepID=A0A7E4VX18_PANRE
MIPFQLLPTLLSTFLPAVYLVYVLISCAKKKAPEPPPPTSTNPPTTPTAVAPSGGVSKTTNTNSKDNKNVSKESRFGEQSTELKTFKDKSNVKPAPEDPDLKSRSNYNVPQSEAKPVSAFMPAKNDKFVSKGGGIFVDKDGNPISQLAEPVAKDAPT